MWLFLKSNQSKFIGTVLVVYSSLFNPTYAIDSLPEEVRLNMGFYANSVTDQADRADIEVSFNFWAKDLFATEAKKHNFDVTSSNAILFDSI